MRNSIRPGRVNVRFVFILVLILLLLGAGAAVGYKIRKRIIANRALAAGKAALEEENWAEACKHLKLYLSKYPNDQEILMRYAEANLSVRPVSSGSIRAAVGAYRLLLRKKPGDDEISDKLANLYIRGREFNEAAYICRRRLDVAPDDADAEVLLAKALVAQRKFEEASEVLRSLAEKRPEEAQTYLLLSGILQREDVPAVREVASELLDPEIVEATQTAVELSLALLDLGVERDPGSALLLANRARLHRAFATANGSSRRAHLEAARADLEAADALQPTAPAVLFLLVEEWMQHGDDDRAEADLKAIQALDAETLAGHEVNLDDIALAKFMAAGRLALSKGQETEGVELANHILEKITDGRRAALIPLAFDLYMAGGDVAKAQEVVAEYREIVQERRVDDPALRDQLVMLEARLAGVSNEPYAVINLLEPLVVANPANRAAWRLLAWAYNSTGQGGRALQALEEYNQRWPNNPTFALRLANAYLASNRWSDALKYARRAERLMPENTEAKLARLKASVRLMSHGPDSPVDSEALLKELSDLRRDRPEDVDVRVLLAIAAIRKGRMDGAVEELERAVEECPEVLAAALLLVDLHTGKGQRDKAMEVCKAAIERHPEVASVRLALAELQLTADRDADARKTLEDAVSALEGEEKAMASRALGQYLLRAGEREAGIGLLQSLAAERPRDPQTRVALLRIREIRSDADQARKLVEELRSIEGDRGLRWRLEQAKLWLEGEPGMPPQERRRQIAGRREELTELLTRCARGDPAWLEPVLALGAMYQIVGDDEAAEEAYEGALARNPGAITVLNELLKLLHRQRRFEEAEKILAEMPERFRRLSVMGAHRVGVALGIADYDTAIRELQEVVAADTQDAASRVLLARVVYLHKKDVDAALKLLDEAEAASPGLLAAVSNRAAILRAEGRYDEALALVNAEVARRRDFTAYLLRAGFYATADQLDLAEEDYKHLTTFKDASGRGCAALGQFYQRHGRTDDAVRAWDEGLKTDAENLVLKRLLIGVLVLSPQESSRERGRAILDELLAQSPDDADLLFVHAAALLAEGTAEAVKEAAATLERVVHLAPGNIRAHLGLVEIAWQAEDLTKVGELIVRARGDNPREVSLLLAQARLEAGLGNLRVAQERARQLMEIDPDNVQIRHLLVDLALRSGDIETAEAVNNEVLELEPANESARLAHAAILRAKGELDRAIEYLEVYRRTDAGRESVKVLLALAESYRIREDFDAAKERIDQATQLGPEDISVLRTHLQWLAGQDRLDDMVALISERAASASDQVAVLSVGAALLATTGQERCIREAVNLYQRVTELSPKQPKGYIGLAQAAYQAGDKDLAERAYRKVVEIDPYHQKGLNDLAWIIGVELDRPGEAIEFATRGTSRYPKDAHLWDTRGMLLLKLGRLDEARADLERCVGLTECPPSTRARALLRLGRILAKQDEPKLVRERLTEALEIDGKHRVLAEAERAEIDQLLKSLPQ